MEKIELFSSFAIPVVVFTTALIIFFGKRDYFSSFISGAKNGCKSAFNLFPSMCALIVGVSMFASSGASEFLCKIISPLFEKIGVPSEIFTLVLTRALSGSASLATYQDVIEKTGVDSFPSLCASVIMGSSDTVVYVLCVYFSTVNIKKTKYALPLCLFLSLLAVFLSCILSRIFF